MANTLTMPVSVLNGGLLQILLSLIFIPFSWLLKFKPEAGETTVKGSLFPTTRADKKESFLIRKLPYYRMITAPYTRYDYVMRLYF
jgi:hypothetical protein